jgi:hypothetical protein
MLFLHSILIGWQVKIQVEAKMTCFLMMWIFLYLTNKSALTRHGILLQTLMTETRSIQSRLQSISDFSPAQLATKTKPVTIFIKIDYRVVHRFEPAIVSSMEKCHYPRVTPPRVRDLLKSQHERKVHAQSTLPARMTRAKRALATILLSESASRPIRRHLTSKTLHGSQRTT